MSLLHLCLGGILLAGPPGQTSTQTAPLQGPSAPQQTIQQPGATHPQKHIKNLKETLKGIEEKKHKETAAPNQQTTISGPFYVYPGVVRLKDNRWVGYDYLYNLTSTIPIEVTLIKPADSTIPINEASLKERIASAFQKSGINTEAQIEGGRPPIALFNLIVLVYPLSDGYIALCEGRLLENVEIKRGGPESFEGTMQAITWEQKNMIVSAQAGFVPLLDQTVDLIVRTFLDRYLFYRNLKK